MLNIGRMKWKQSAQHQQNVTSVFSYKDTCQSACKIQWLNGARQHALTTPCSRRTHCFTASCFSSEPKSERASSPVGLKRISGSTGDRQTKRVLKLNFYQYFLCTVSMFFYMVNTGIHTHTHMKLIQPENWRLTVLELVEAVFAEAFLVDVLPGLFVRVAREEVLADFQLWKGIRYI